MLMLLAMPFSIAAIRIAAILKRIAAMLPLLHHCDNAAIARGIAAMPFGIAATPQYFPDVSILVLVCTLLTMAAITRAHLGNYSFVYVLAFQEFYITPSKSHPTINYDL